MDVTTLTLSELETLLEEYPWFTLARKEYIWRHGEMGEDALRRAAAEAGLYLLSRAEYLKEVELRRKREEEARAAAAKAAEESASGNASAGTGAPAAESGKPRIFVVGGDYFGKEEYAELEEEGLAFDTSALAFNPIASALGAIGQDTAEAVVKPRVAPSGDDEFCTETLARIYFEQEFYQRAIEIYEKLILLYPEKSAYFATLIDKARNIKQS